MKLRPALVWVLMGVLIGQAQAQPTEPDTVTLNFVNADIEAVV